MADSISPTNETIMNITDLNFSRFSALLFFGILLSGCAAPQSSKDPYESVNRSIFSFNEKADKYALKPVAEGYKAVLPEPAQIMAANFFSNLDDFVVVINDLLQLKFSEAGSDGTRLLINTFLGMGGLVNYGEDYGFPKRHEDFGQTLAHYGVSSGPYIVLPILGGSTFRDAGSGLVDMATNPLFSAGFFMGAIAAPVIGAARAVDARAQLLDKEEIVDEAALDKYEFLRDAYLQRRRSLIYDGDPPRSIDDEIDGPVQETSAPVEKKRSIVVEYIDPEDSGNQDEPENDSATE
jgi:phospholipid-binding lipoprotein MlaA